MGGRATSGLQGEYGQDESAPDWLGGLDLIAAGVSTQANQGVFLLMCLRCVVVEKESRKEREQRDRGDRRPRDRLERTL